MLDFGGYIDAGVLFECVVLLEEDLKVHGEVGEEVEGGEGLPML
jgi:hypothetical protein